MAISLNKFRNMATQRSETTVIERARESQNELHGTGFWGRLFGKGGADTVKNQDVIEEFIAAIQEEMGLNLANVARNALQKHIQTGKPLRGRIVQDILKLTATERARVAESNNDLAGRYLATPAPDQGLEKRMADFLPPDSRLREVDIKEIRHQVVKFTQVNSERNALLSKDDLDDAVRDKLGNALARATPEFLERVDALCQEGVPPYTPTQIQSLRPLIISSGVNLGAELHAALALMTYVLERLPRLRAARTGLEILDILSHLNRARERIYFKDRKGEELRSAPIFNLVIPGAFALGGLSEQEAKDLSENVLCGPSGKETLNILNTIITGGNEPGQTRPQELKDMFKNLLAGFVWACPVAVDKIEALPMSGEGMALTKEMRAYLQLSGIFLDREMEMLGKANGFDSLRNFTPVSALDLARVLISGGDDDEYSLDKVNGFRIMNIFLPQIKQASASSGPFSKAVVWNAIFNRNPGPDVTQANLATKIGIAWDATVDQAVRAKNPAASRRIIDVAIATIESAMLFGVNPHRALSVFLSDHPGDKFITFADMSLPTRIMGPQKASRESLHETLEALARDLPQRRGSCTVTIAGADINLDADAIADVEQRQRYLAGDVDNPVMNGIVRRIDSALGDGEHTLAMRQSVFRLFGQTSTMPLFYLSPVVGLALSEHSPMNMRMRLTDAGQARIVAESPTESQGTARMEYEVDKDGNITLIDFHLSGR